ncbi:MAG: hypothetical protein M1497_08165 [Nitrospirae bacterium]|nr:hypothetical protein [Nitrospirota bacterium]
MVEHGDCPEKAQEELQDDTVITLRRPEVKKEENPLWFSDPSAPSDWFYDDE